MTASWSPPRRIVFACLAIVALRAALIDRRAASSRDVVASRQLLTATTAAGVKTVLAGDAHQLAPVKARGGMFAYLCADLPWVQHLSQVWRMRDPAERAASLGLRDGDPAGQRRAVDWYRHHGRLRCRDVVTMASDALTAYRDDIDAWQERAAGV
jgi:hypothetical protein